MAKEKFKVISYSKNNGTVELVSTVYKGNYDDCLRFYINNKSKYREKNRFLELMVG